MLILLASMAEKNRAIGKANKMLWDLPKENQVFEQITRGQIMIMGKNTFLERGGKRMPGRTTIVVSRTLMPEDCLRANCFADALTEAGSSPSKLIFIVGGARLFKEALPLAEKVFLTVVKGDFEGDVFLPQFEDDFTIDTVSLDEPDYTVYVYTRKPLQN